LADAVLDAVVGGVTTSLLALVTVLAEQTKSAPPTVMNTRPVVLVTAPPVIQRAPIVFASGLAAG
jgi:hypothetical protein